MNASSVYRICLFVLTSSLFLYTADEEEILITAGISLYMYSVYIVVCIPVTG
jgi:hypothetical protein